MILFGMDGVKRERTSRKSWEGKNLEQSREKTMRQGKDSEERDAAARALLLIWRLSFMMMRTITGTRTSYSILVSELVEST